MSLRYLKHSDTQVQVYPSANRLMELDLKARLTDEFNITNLVNRLLDTDGYVITKNVYENGLNKGIVDKNEFEFCIKGYYFRVGTAGKIITLFEGSYGVGEGQIPTIYANMYLGQMTRTVPNSNNVTYTSQTLLGIEENGNTYVPTYLDEVNGVTSRFLGIGFSLEKVVAENVYSLLILRREKDSDGNEWNRIPQESKIKMQSTALTDVSVKISDGIL